MPFDTASATGSSVLLSPGANLADLRDAAATDAALDKTRRAQTLWALNAIEPRAGYSLAQMAADFDTVTDLKLRLRRSPQGLSKASIGNLLYRLRFAIRRYIPQPPKTAMPVLAAPLMDEADVEAWNLETAAIRANWMTLMDRLEVRITPFQLHHLARWCAAQHIDISDVTLGTFDTYAAVAISHMKNPAKHMQILRAAWNRGVDQVQGWPQFKLPSPPPRGSLSAREAEIHPELWTALKAHYREREAARNQRRSLLAPSSVAGLRPKSAQRSLALVRRALGQMRDMGEPIGDIRTIADLIEPERLRRTLVALEDRKRCPTGTQPANVASTFVALAEQAVYRGVNTPEALEAIATLKEMSDVLRPEFDGMVESRRITLLPLKDRATRRKLFQLPEQLAAHARRMKKGKAAARLFQQAVAIELFLITVMRLTNVAQLRLGQHIKEYGSGPDRKVWVVLLADEVKNDKGKQLQLPAETVALMDEYRRDFRPMLVTQEDGFLFPGRKVNKSRSEGSLGQAVTGAIRNALGLHVVPHLFRAIAVMHHLQRCPGDFATMQAVLGHKRLETTLKHYAWLDDEVCHHDYQGYVIEERTVHAPLRPGRNERRRKGGGRGRW